MAFAITVNPQTTVNGGVNAASVNLTINGCTAGNAIIFGAYWSDPSTTISSATLTGESNGTLIGTAPHNSGSNGDAKCQLGYFQNLAAGGNKTLTINFSGAPANGLGIWAFEVSGGSTTALLDAHNEGTGTSGTPSISVTTTAANDLLVGIVAGGTGADPSAGSGFTIIAVTQFGVRNAGEYKLDAGAAGSKSVDFTLGTSDDYVVAAAAFKLAGGSSTTVTPGVGSATINGRAPATSAFTAVRIREVLVNNSGQVVANATNIRLMVWYGGQCKGAADFSVNGQTSDPNGTTSWSVATGTLAFNDSIFFVAQDSISFSNYAAGRMTPSYE
jgi:hypothetical protein